MEVKEVKERKLCRGCLEVPPVSGREYCPFCQGVIDEDAAIREQNKENRKKESDMRDQITGRFVKNGTEVAGETTGVVNAIETVVSTVNVEMVTKEDRHLVKLISAFLESKGITGQPVKDFKETFGSYGSSLKRGNAVHTLQYLGLFDTFVSTYPYWGTDEGSKEMKRVTRIYGEWMKVRVPA